MVERVHEQMGQVHHQVEERKREREGGLPCSPGELGKHQKHFQLVMGQMQIKNSDTSGHIWESLRLKRLAISSVGKGVEEMEYSFITVGNVKLPKDFGNTLFQFLRSETYTCHMIQSLYLAI